ncbi:MAG: hypothetical protein ABIE42_01555 [Candidatus Eisenbacteria bacterium]
MSESALKAKIVQKVAARVADLRGREAMRVEYPNYVRDLVDNLAPGIAFGDFRPDFEGADGGELVSSGGRPQKLCAVHSSAALAVNTFAPYRRTPESLSLAGRSGFTFACFEKKLRTGLGGTPPNLDFFAVGEEAVVAVESKFTELLSRKAANFSESYATAISELADARWAQMHRSLCSEPGRFRYLDAAQLVKHYLGIRYSLAEEQIPKALLYLFWEPENWPEVPAFSRHRCEVLEFSMAVAGGEVEFTAVSYPELWDSWEELGAWDGAEDRLHYLRERYVFGA